MKNNSRDYGKIRTESPAYEVLPGIRHKKYLITYNNDYTEDFPEGIRYKILSDSLKVSASGEVLLPYNDRECNIKKIIYDDGADHLYILCEIFRLEDKKHRVTDHFSVFNYNLASSQLLEGKAAGMPDSSTCQMAVTEHNIYLLNFQAPKFISENDSLTLYRFDKEKMALQSVHVNHFSSDFVSRINRTDKKYSFRYFQPADFIAGSDSSLAGVYEYRFDSKDINGGDIGAAIIGGLLFGVVGSLIMYSAATSGDAVPYVGDLLFMNVDSSGFFFPQLISRAAMQRDPTHNSFYPVLNGNKLHLFYNDRRTLKNWYSSCVCDAAFDFAGKEFVIDSTRFAAKKIYSLQLGSVCDENPSVFFTGRMDFNLDPEAELNKRYCIVKYVPE
jgi:hypothetical protein